MSTRSTNEIRPSDLYRDESADKAAECVFCSLVSVFALDENFENIAVNRSACEADVGQGDFQVRNDGQQRRISRWLLRVLGRSRFLEQRTCLLRWRRMYRCLPHG